MKIMTVCQDHERCGQHTIKSDKHIRHHLKKKKRINTSGIKNEGTWAIYANKMQNYAALKFSFIENTANN